MSPAPGAPGSPEWFAGLASGGSAQLLGYLSAMLPYLFGMALAVLGIYAVIKIAHRIVGAG